MLVRNPVPSFSTKTSRKFKELFCVHKTQNPVLCRQKRSFFHWGYSSKRWRIVPTWPLLGSIKRIPSRVTASGYIFRSTFRSLSDVLCSDECRTKKAFQYVKRMLPLFRAVVKFCTTNRLLHTLDKMFIDFPAPHFLSSHHFIYGSAEL